MNPAATRLVLLNGTSAYRRLGSIVAGVALGTGLLLILVGAYLHLPDRDDRAAWATYGGQRLDAEGPDAEAPVPDDGHALRTTVVNIFLDGTYTSVSVAATPDSSVALPGGLALPAPGEYYASPAMARLIDSHPQDLLGDRFGTRIGELPDALLRGPSDRVVVVGQRWTALAPSTDTVLMSAFPTSGNPLGSGTSQFVIAVGSIAVLVPIILLISIVSQLGATERRERFATVRLVGAGRRAIALLSGLEMFVASLVGGALGIGVAAALRPLASTLTLSGTTSYTRDLTASAQWTVTVVLAVAVLGGGTAWWRTYRDDVGALGAVRERAEKRVTAWRSLTLFLGLSMLVIPAIAFQRDPKASEVFNYVLLLGFMVTVFGMVVAGPWLTSLTAHVMGRFAKTAPAVVAAGRLARHSRSTFRSVAGLVVAVFTVSMFAGVVSAIETTATPRDTPGALSSDAIVAPISRDAEADAVSSAVQGLEGTDRVVVAYATPEDELHHVMTSDEARALGSQDVPDAAFVVIDLLGMFGAGVFADSSAVDAPVAWSSGIEGLEPSLVVVVTDGSPDAIERARTAIEVATASWVTPTTRADYAKADALTFTHELGVMAYLGMAVAIGISALSLTVATVAAALDRKRTFALLRLGGMPARDLRRVIATEATLPLAATLVMSAGLGFLVAWLMIGAVGSDLTMGWPDARYWIAIAASVALGVAAVAGSFGLVRRSTEVTSTRFE